MKAVMNEIEQPDTRSRVLGSFLGGAAGDALGEPVEFMDLNEILRLVGPQGVTGYWDRAVRPGAFSDDTQMTLWTAEGLIRAYQGGDPAPADIRDSVRAAYRRWYRTQTERFDDSNPATDGWLFTERGLWVRMAPGSTCLSAMHAGGTGTTSYPINDSKGCGGVMRVTPVGFLPGDDEEIFTLGCDLAAMTHGNSTGFIAAGALALIIARLVAGDDLETAIDVAVERVAAEGGDGEECLHALRRAIEMAAAGTPSSREVERIGAGWVAEQALAIAIYCALAADDFRSGVLLSVNHSGDSDSTGSITGQILGAQLGVEAIPADWIGGLGLRTVVERVAQDFHDANHLSRELSEKAYPSW